MEMLEMFVDLGWVLIKTGLVLIGFVLILFLVYATIGATLKTILRMSKKPNVTEFNTTKPPRPMGLVPKRKEDVND